ncbi:MAG: hypothetical protein IBX53_03340 [Halomonas sp.]|uniref:hypothetical protein n=1 Tax=Halomonas sp. TaxID=1486246 RepID=UPI0019DB5772|nr:hypothetical protein [Halomonas sp.]MBE0488091.1 hypothetical protein [Halomonas sp.]
MKHSTIMTTALLTGMLAMGLATQSSAMVTNGTFELKNGNTPSRMIPGVDHYRFEVNSSSELRVESQLWSPAAAGGRMKAELRDGNGNVVARSNSRGKDFVLQQSLSPGRYTLEVHGSQLGGRKESTQRYYLNTDLR